MIVTSEKCPCGARVLPQRHCEKCGKICKSVSTAEPFKLQPPHPMLKTRLEELREACQRFHEANPDVWELFVKFTNDRIGLGFKNYGANAIIERIRWETDSGSTDSSQFKVNDHFPPFYARRFMAMYPEHKGFFRLRKQTSQDDPALNRGELGPDDYPEEGGHNARPVREWRLA